MIFWGWQFFINLTRGLFARVALRAITRKKANAKKEKLGFISLAHLCFARIV